MAKGAGEIEQPKIDGTAPLGQVTSSTLPPLAADAKGRIDPVAFAAHMRDKIAASSLSGQVPAWGPKFGIKTGSPDEWARFYTMVQQQESGNRIAPVNPDGSLQRFPTTPRGERSFGPGQFNVGEYGLKTWADVNNPAKVADAYIQVAQQGNVPAYFGSVQRPNETLQHARWYDTTVAPKIGEASMASMLQDTGRSDAQPDAPTPLPSAAPTQLADAGDPTRAEKAPEAGGFDWKTFGNGIASASDSMPSPKVPQIVLPNTGNRRMAQMLMQGGGYRPNRKT